MITVDATRAKEREMQQADAWLARAASRLELLMLDAAPYPNRESGVHVKGVSMAPDDAREDRRIAFSALEAAVWWDRALPPVFGYYAGLHQGQWVLEVYARGEPLPVLPEPPKPDFMK